MRSTYQLISALLLAAGLAAGASSSMPVRGASFTVNSTADTVDATPGDGTCADAGGACTLRAAITETNALPGADAITVPAGIYKLTHTVSGHGENAVVGIGIGDDLHLSGAGAAATAVDGGKQTAIFAVGLDLSRSVSVEIANISIRNALSFVGAGGIGVNNGNALVLRRVLVTGNEGGSAGGMTVQGTAHVFDSTFADNGGDPGGAITVRGTLTIANSTISGNRGRGVGGIRTDYGTSTLTNVTIANNTGTGTHGVQAKNSIIASNQAADCVTSLGYNLLGSLMAGCSPGANDIVNADPMLGPLADNGGGTPTHALLPGSPAINAGDNNGCPATDQRGVARPQQGVCDIGTYEHVPPATTPPTPPPTSPPPPPPAAVRATVARTPEPTVEPTASPSPTRSPRPTPKRTRTPTPSALAVSVSESDGGGSGLLIAGVTLGVLGVGGAAGGGGYYWYRRRGRGAI